MALPDEVLATIRAQIAEGKKMLPVLEADIRDAQRAGVDVTELQKQLTTSKDKLRKIDAVYGERTQSAGKRTK